jgi:hypothetical protein
MIGQKQGSGRFLERWARFSLGQNKGPAHASAMSHAANQSCEKKTDCQAVMSSQGMGAFCEQILTLFDVLRVVYPGVPVPALTNVKDANLCSISAVFTQSADLDYYQGYLRPKRPFCGHEVTHDSGCKTKPNRS